MSAPRNSLAATVSDRRARNNKLPSDLLRNIRCVSVDTVHSPCCCTRLNKKFAEFTLQPINQCSATPGSNSSVATSPGPAFKEISATPNNVWCFFNCQPFPLEEHCTRLPPPPHGHHCCGVEDAEACSPAVFVRGLTPHAQQTSKKTT